jgi:CO/xanthine dehydrogenase Mo-binding subunit/aerobic-type carbon monoxide dehydrogenase small subunit (CoxS/CutS family)
MNESAGVLAQTASAPGTIDFRLNGVACSVEAHPLARLSGVLRETLGLIGTKVGCEAGDCGACTVLLDDEQVCSCLVAAGQVRGRSVVTIEGIGDASSLQKSFLVHGAVQCGVCTPGMLMAAQALLSRHPAPDASQVRDALAGVLCRCTGYQNIVQAVLAVSRPANPIAAAEQAAAVGACLTKVDGAERVAGAARFAADAAPSDALWLRVVRSPHARARFRLGELDRWIARYRGVSVITARDVPCNRFAVFAAPKDQPVLADGEVRFVGEAVLALVGPQAAVMAVDVGALPIDWQVEVPVESIAQALERERIVHRFAPDNILIRGRVVTGDAEGIWGTAAVQAEGDFTTSYVEHAYIEPEAGFAEPFRGEDGRQRLRVYACTQAPYLDRDEIARILAVSPAQIHIVPSAIGGGFGGKLDLSIQPLLAVAAWKLERPVRGVYTRGESMLSTPKRHPARLRARFACARDGRLLAAAVQGDFNTGAYASWGATVANRVPIHACGPYRVPHVSVATRAIYTNGPIAGAFRGFGVPQATFAHETLLDDLAEQLGIDPLEMRLRNALRAGDRTATGQILQASVGLEQCLLRLQPGWNATRQRTAQHNTGARRIRRGVGLACMWYGIGNTVIANPSTIRAGLRRDGRVVLYNGAIDMGQGSTTVIAQICADATGLPVGSIDQIVGDTDLTPDAGKSSASRQTFVSGNAARIAGMALREELLRLLGLGEGCRLHLEEGVLAGSSADREARLDLALLPADAAGIVAMGEGSFDPPTTPLDADGQGVPYATYAFAAQFAEIEVDMALGTVRVLRVEAAHDVGRAINPMQVEGQIHGGIAQGLGMALMEEYIAGQTDNLHDYLIPTIGDMPEILVHIVEDPEPLGPHGAKGVGEPALIPTAPAILNAIRHATGARITHLPATPDRVLAALRCTGRS